LQFYIDKSLLEGNSKIDNTNKLLIFFLRTSTKLEKRTPTLQDANIPIFQNKYHFKSTKQKSNGLNYSTSKIQ
jgi:hypothetical protein